MTHRYANMDHAGWVESATGKTLSDIGRKAAYILGIVAGGIYNAPINHSKVNWNNPYYIEVAWRGDMATFDFDQLTKLVLLAHHFCIRVEVTPCNPQCLRLLFHPRKGRTGGIAQRHPDIEEAVAMFRETWPRIGQEREAKEQQ